MNDTLYGNLHSYYATIRSDAPDRLNDTIDTLAINHQPPDWKDPENQDALYKFVVWTGHPCPKNVLDYFKAAGERARAAGDHLAEAQAIDDRINQARQELTAAAAQPEPDTELIKKLLENYSLATIGKAPDVPGSLTTSNLFDYGSCEGYPIDFWNGLRIPAPGATLIGAKTGGGKTSALVNIARNLLEQGKTCAFISYEMNAQEIGLALMLSITAQKHLEPIANSSQGEYKHRLHSPFSLPDYNKDIDDFFSALKKHIQNNGHPPAMAGAVTAIKDHLANNHLAIIDAMGTADKLAEWIKSTAFDAYIIDYAQAVTPAPDAPAEGYRRIGATVDRLRPVVNAGKKCLILGAQFNRSSGETEGLAEFDPDVEQFREAADLEQVATMAIGIGWKMEKPSDKKKTHYWKILKHRFSGNMRSRRMVGENMPEAFDFYLLRPKGIWTKPEDWKHAPKAAGKGTAGKPYTGDINGEQTPEQDRDAILESAEKKTGKRTVKPVILEPGQDPAELLY